MTTPDLTEARKLAAKYVHPLSNTIDALADELERLREQQAQQDDAITWATGAVQEIIGQRDALKAQVAHLVDDLTEEVAGEEGATYYRLRGGKDVLFSNLVGACARLLAAPAAGNVATQAVTVDDGQAERAEAWEAVAALLTESFQDWDKKAQTGREAALATIRELAARPAQSLTVGETMAWAHPDGRVVTAATKAQAEVDGGAMRSSLAGYTIPLGPIQPTGQAEPVAPTDREATADELTTYRSISAGYFKDAAQAEPAAANASRVTWIDGVGACRPSLESCRDGVSFIKIGGRCYYPLTDAAHADLIAACYGRGEFPPPTQQAEPVAPTDREATADELTVYRSISTGYFKDSAQAEPHGVAAYKMAKSLADRLAVVPAAQAEPVAWIEHYYNGTGQRRLHFERRPATVRDEVIAPMWTPLYAASNPPAQGTVEPPPLPTKFSPIWVAEAACFKDHSIFIREHLENRDDEWRAAIAQAQKEQP